MGLCVSKGNIPATIREAAVQALGIIAITRLFSQMGGNLAWARISKLPGWGKWRAYVIAMALLSPPQKRQGQRKESKGHGRVP